MQMHTLSSDAKVEVLMMIEMLSNYVRSELPLDPVKNLVSVSDYSTHRREIKMALIKIPFHQ
jgi:hypothetical protein